MIIMKTCKLAWSAANLVAGACKFNWLTAGPPGKSLTAKADVVKPAKASALLLAIFFQCWLNLFTLNPRKTVQEMTNRYQRNLD
jgi:hypothetical protein